MAVLEAAVESGKYSAAVEGVDGDENGRCKLEIHNKIIDSFNSFLMNFLPLFWRI